MRKRKHTTSTHFYQIILSTDTAGEEITLYTPGAKDLCAGFFYLLICIVVHAVVQEYVLDVSIPF